MDTPAQHRRNQTKFEKKPSEIHKRVLRNAARREMLRAGRVHKGDHKDVDHINGTKSGNSSSNLRIVSRHRNRAYHRSSSGKQIRPV